jgi:hypothetical protein
MRKTLRYIWIGWMMLCLTALLAVCICILAMAIAYILGTNTETVNNAAFAALLCFVGASAIAGIQWLDKKFN